MKIKEKLMLDRKGLEEYLAAMREMHELFAEMLFRTILSDEAEDAPQSSGTMYE